MYVYQAANQSISSAWMKDGQDAVTHTRHTHIKCSCQPKLIIKTLSCVNAAIFDLQQLSVMTAFIFRLEKCPHIQFVSWNNRASCKLTSKIVPDWLRLAGCLLVWCFTPRSGCESLWDYDKCSFSLATGCNKSNTLPDAHSQQHMSCEYLLLL